MRSLLDALQEGRLVELPVNDKDQVLEYIALLIEAIPDIGTKNDIVKEVLDREVTSNTGIGKGVACPHARSKAEGELLCAVGWSPEGIEYGSMDGEKVHLVVMYYIPDSQRNVYLKEISGLAKAIKESETIGSFKDLSDIQSVRHRLLDWVEIAINKAGPDAKARMIKLDVKQAVVESAAPVVIPAASGRKLDIIPFSLLVVNSEKFIALSHNTDFVEAIEKGGEIFHLLTGRTDFEWEGYQILVNSIRQYSMNRILYDGVAVR